MDWRGVPSTSGGVTQRAFEIAVGDGLVPGSLWMPVERPDPVPLILLGYGSGGHSRDGARSWQGEWFGLRGLAAASIDVPGHGERALPDGSRPDYGLLLDDIVAEWRACLDSLLAVPGIDSGRIGYRGVSMGTMLGLPFVASEPRVSATMFGLADFSDEPGRFTGVGLRLRRDAPRIACPILFTMNWDDELVNRESALSLFDTLGSKDKELRAYPGPHGSAPPGATEAAMQYLVDRLVRR